MKIQHTTFDDNTGCSCVYTKHVCVFNLQTLNMQTSQTTFRSFPTHKIRLMQIGLQVMLMTKKQNTQIHCWQKMKPRNMCCS